MLSVLIHKVSEMKPQIRAAVEAELGRSLRDDEEVSIMAFEPHSAPTGESRRDAARALQEHFNRIDQNLARPPGRNQKLWHHQEGEQPISFQLPTDSATENLRGRRRKWTVSSTKSIPDEEMEGAL